MIRIAHLADLHWDERARLADVLYVHYAFLEAAREAGADLIAIAGDIFERKSTPLERWHVARWLQLASEVAPVVGVKGNHDQAGDLDVFNLLHTTHPVHILDRPSAEPGSAYEVAIGGGRRIGIVALPWFDRAHLVASLDASVDAEQTRLITIDTARGLLACLGAEAARLRSQGAIPILVGHVLVAGSEVSTGQTLIGTTVELSPADLLGVGAAYAALGHVHKHQSWYGGRVAYSGSPNRCNFGEGREAKGWCLVTLTDDGQFLSNEFQELPARRMVLIEVDWTSVQAASILREQGINVCFGLGVGGWNDDQDVKDALVRFRYHVRAEDLHLVDEAAIEKCLLADGAHEVKLEAVVVAETRARAPEIVHVQTTAEKVESYLRAKQIEVDAATLARLRTKVGMLEEVRS